MCRKRMSYPDTFRTHLIVFALHSFGNATTVPASFRNSTTRVHKSVCRVFAMSPHKAIYFISPKTFGDSSTCSASHPTYCEGCRILKLIKWSQTLRPL